MQNKGIIRLFAILFGLVSIYQLSFTFITNKAEKDAEIYAEQKISTDVENYGELRHQAVSQYLDSIAKEPIFAGITYNTAREKQLNKGLDLKGGISVILQISVNDLLVELSDHSTDPAFEKAIAQANEKLKTSQDTYLNLFFEAFNEIPGARLASPSIFGNKQLSGEVDFDMTNEEVQRVLTRRVNESISSAFEVLNQRIDKFGVAQPNIQRLGESGRILVELPGAQDIDRAKNLLQSTAQLEFWPVYQAKDFSQFLRQADATLQEIKTAKKEKAEEVPTDSIQEAIDTTETDEDDIEALLSTEDTLEDLEDETSSPLMSLIRGMGFDTGPVLAEFYVQDTAKVNSYLKEPKVRALLPNDKKYVRFAWGLPDEKTDLVGLYAIKSNKRNEAPLTGSAVTDANQTYDQMSRIAVSLEMNAQGARVWEELTGQAYRQGTQIAIVLDNTVYSAPGVTSGPISGGRSEITGDFSIQEGKDLATVLKAGKLPASADIVQIEIVGPSLGQEAITAGLLSFVIALFIVFGYMIFYYGRAGLFADIALAVNLLFVFGILAGLGAVLTLPGIAGIVLTIGMSVDANVLIFERTREELRAGKGQAQAIKDGFKNALPSILDANITTFLTGLILLAFGTGPVKGFATTLLIGICTSLFTAIFITRLNIESYTKNGKSLPFSTNITKDWFSKVHLNITGKRKIFYVVSAIAVIISLGSLFTTGLNQGVDFVGGRSFTVRFDKEVNPTEIEQNLVEPFGSAEVKTYGSANQVKITTAYKVDESSREVEDEITENLYQALKPELPASTTLGDFIQGSGDKDIGIMSSIKVGPSIADDIKSASFWAVLASLVGIFLYILFRFRKWQFSLGAIAAILHDTIILVGIFSLFKNIMPFSMEIDQTFIAAILTVVGYSINDTVVVFDRIREYFRIHPRWGLVRNINASISSTIGRTFNTSMSTLLVLIAMFIFGGEGLRTFTFSLIIGIAIGTYSSIFIASPIMYEVMKRKGDDILIKEEKERAENAA